MIPLRLTVRNFLCYRNDVGPLNFEGMHVACLCGANGHGKSALLDAITWSLWGQARTGNRNFDSLITHGESECRVELDFQSRGQVYRVVRRRRSANRGRTELDLFIVDRGGDGAEDAVRPITGNTLRETDAKICHIVGMDYATFVNSAFLLQGESDAFTRKSPSERKEVLASILGLGLYEALQDGARERRDYYRNQMDLHQGALQQAQAEIDSIPDPSEELTDVEQRMSQLDDELVVRAVEIEQLRVSTGELRAKGVRLQETAKRIESMRLDIQRTESESESVRQQIEKARGLTLRADEIAAGASALASARERYRVLEQDRLRFDQLREERDKHLRTVDRVRTELQAQVESIGQRINDDLRPAAQRASIVGRELEECAELERMLSVEQGQLDVQITEFAEIQGRVARLGGELERCVTDGKSLRANQEQMLAADAVCPLCRTPLDQDACGSVVEFYEAEIAAKLEQHREIQAVIRENAGMLDELQRHIEKTRKDLTSRTTKTQRERGRWEREREYGEAAQKQIDDLLPQLEASVSVLEAETYAEDDRFAVAKIEAQILELGYEEEQRQQSFEMIQALQHWETEQVELNAASARLPEDEFQFARVCKQTERLHHELAEMEIQLVADQQAARDLPAVEQQLRIAQDSADGLTRDRNAAAERRGFLVANAERRGRLRSEIARLTTVCQQDQNELAVYTELFVAFGRSGVPAMLIDAAVPRIETEANLLLGRMTDNRMAVRLQTQRTNQGGSLTETLDILVSDELGARSYEVFSGGEAFRINLALRIALSKVLAQRMGVPLPTLFIDEGFGTQDASGRERIVDTISSIQIDFEMIIVITHLDDIKDLFPVRIEVEKTASGSNFWVSA